MGQKSNGAAPAQGPSKPFCPIVCFQANSRATGQP